MTLFNFLQIPLRFRTLGSVRMNMPNMRESPLLKPTRAQSIAAEMTRREAMALLGTTGALTLAGCGINVTGSDGSGTASCVVTPALTEGPYFVDELLNRSDIRTDPTDGSVQPGVPLQLTITVSKISGSTCSPFEAANVDVWHCNAEGLYSDEAANGTLGKKFLRGYQVTDADGVVNITTVYPGWYSGRTPHIHFKVRMGTLEFTSQWFFDESITAQVYSQSPYNTRGSPDTTNARDGIYDSQTLLALTADAGGYAGNFDIALRS